MGPVEIENGEEESRRFGCIFSRLRVSRGTRKSDSDPGVWRACCEEEVAVARDSGS